MTSFNPKRFQHVDTSEDGENWYFVRRLNQSYEGWDPARRDITGMTAWKGSGLTNGFLWQEGFNSPMNA